MSRRSQEKELAALMEWSSEAGSAEGVLGAEESGFGELAAQRARRAGRRCFPMRDVAALEVAASAAEARRAERKSEAEAVSGSAVPRTSLATMVVTAAGIMATGCGMAIALPAGKARQIAIGAALAAVSLAIIVLHGGLARTFRLHRARLAYRRASRAVERTRVAIAAAGTQEQEREHWVCDTTRLLIANHAFHVSQAALAVEATAQDPFFADAQLPN